MVTFRNMVAFVAVVEQGSFSKAGRELRVSTAVVSARVARLEEEIGVRLLNRTTRQVSPTEEALKYYEDCTKILVAVALSEERLSTAKQSPKGSLKVTAPVVFGRRHIAPMIPRFADLYPELQLQLRLSDRIEDLVGDKLDVAIRIGHLPSSTLMARKLADSRRTFVAAPSYLEENGAPRHPTELLNHNCLLLRFPGSTQFQWQYAEEGILKTLAVDGRFDSDNGDVLRQWALAGEGIALAHRWEVNEDIQAGRLIPILLDTPPMPVPISAVYAQGSHMPSRSRLFIDYLSNLFKDGIPD